MKPIFEIPEMMPYSNISESIENSPSGPKINESNGIKNILSENSLSNFGNLKPETKRIIQPVVDGMTPPKNTLRNY